jgi:hypothetical protein
MALFHADYDRAWLGLGMAAGNFLLEVDAWPHGLFDVLRRSRQKHANRSARSRASRWLPHYRVTAWAEPSRASRPSSCAGDTAVAAAGVRNAPRYRLRGFEWFMRRASSSPHFARHLRD